MINLEIIGYLGQEATTKEVNGRNVINFSVAHTDKIVNKETAEVREILIWVKCDFWTDKPSPLAKFLTKGKLVRVIGRPSIKQYKNKDNKLIASLQISILSNRDILLLSSGKKEDTATMEATNEFNENNNEYQPELVDDLPY